MTEFFFVCMHETYLYSSNVLLHVLLYSTIRRRKS